MADSETKNLHPGNPYIALHGYNLRTLSRAELMAVSFDAGTMYIDERAVADRLSPQLFRTAILASLGFSNQAIGNKTHTSVNTTKTNIRRAYAKLEASKPEDVMRVDRGSLTRCLLGAGAYVIGKAAAPLPLTIAETEAVSLIAAGYSNEEAAAELGSSPGTIKLHLAHVILNQHWQEASLSSTRSALATRAIMSKEVSYTAPVNSELQQVISALHFFDIEPAEGAA